MRKYRFPAYDLMSNAFFALLHVFPLDVLDTFSDVSNVMVMGIPGVSDASVSLCYQLLN